MSSIPQPYNSSKQNPPLSPRCVQVCQNRTCRKQGAKAILTAFLSLSVPEITVKSSGCLGQCGNGPMVLVLPDEVWYCSVRLNEVPLVIEQHLLNGKVVPKMLYPKFHPKN
ncbi:MAG: (2Fe-2S) ferredoxin domain-containing protein [Cyanobacteria bacterium P01_A01_bin.84]